MNKEIFNYTILSDGSIYLMDATGQTVENLEPKSARALIQTLDDAINEKMTYYHHDVHIIYDENSTDIQIGCRFGKLALAHKLLDEYRREEWMKPQEVYLTPGTRVQYIGSHAITDNEQYIVGRTSTYEQATDFPTYGLISLSDGNIWSGHAHSIKRPPSMRIEVPFTELVGVSSLEAAEAKFKILG